jgi:hypothetical protein
LIDRRHGREVVRPIGGDQTTFGGRAVALARRRLYPLLDRQLARRVGGEVEADGVGTGADGGHPAHR